MLRSVSHRKLYSGHTENLVHRIKVHNSGRTKSIKAFIPYELIYYEIYGIQNARYAQDSEEVFAKRAKLWSERWSFECDKLSLENVGVHIFLQPILGTGNKSYSEYESYLINDKSLPKVSQYYDLFRKELPKLSEKCNSINDISDVFDNVNVPIYFDLAHTSDLGNKIIAEKIFDKIYHDIEIQILNKNK